MALIAEALRDSAVFNFAGAVTMIVDDSPFSLALTANALSGFGIRTRHACHSAAEAIRILNERTVDLLFVDCEMPDMDGVAATQRIRAACSDDEDELDLRQRELEQCPLCCSRFQTRDFCCFFLRLFLPLLGVRLDADDGELLGDRRQLLCCFFFLPPTSRRRLDA